MPLTKRGEKAVTNEARHRHGDSIFFGGGNQGQRRNRLLWQGIPEGRSGKVQDALMLFTPMLNSFPFKRKSTLSSHNVAIADSTSGKQTLFSRRCDS